MGRQERKEGRSTGLASLARRLGRPKPPVSRATPFLLVDIELTSGAELEERLLQQGLSPGEVVFKYCWPRYAPPAASGIRSLAKFENLGRQFERLIAMHREAPSGIPMPVATVRSTEGEFVGYIFEYVVGETLRELLDVGAFDEAGRRLDAVERTLVRLHARSLPHGDINPSNIIAADDGRTLLIDPVANPGPGTTLQDELCLRELRELIDEVRGCGSEPQP
jgi:serine/threonine protein kinase